MSRAGWVPGSPRSAYEFTRFSAQELNAQAEAGLIGFMHAEELALPVSGDLTAVMRGRDRW